MVDEFSEDIGFRSFQLASGKFILNGEPIFIKSVNYVVDYPKVDAAVDDVNLEKRYRSYQNIGSQLDPCS